MMSLYSSFVTVSRTISGQCPYNSPTHSYVGTRASLRKMEEVEGADILIRLFDYAGRRGLDLAGATYEKGNYNLNRSDHKIADREGEEGKKF